MKNEKLHRKVLWITETAVMLALLVSLQALTKSLGQLVTGSCVNTVLAVAALFAGLGSGITIALISPVLAFLLGIAPNALTVPAIMVGNVAYVTVLFFLADRSGKNILRQAIAWVTAAAVKFGVLYGLVVWLICGLLSSKLLESGAMKPPMLKLLPASFGVTQLYTALIGGAVALVMAPMLRKALHRK